MLHWSFEDFKTKFDPLREDTHKKKVFFLVVGPLRGGGVTPPTTKQKTTFFSINGENSPGSCIMKILFYEVRHLVQIFTSVHPILSVYIFTVSKTIFAKKTLTFLAQKFLNYFFLSKSVLGREMINIEGYSDQFIKYQP